MHQNDAHTMETELRLDVVFDELCTAAGVAMSWQEWAEECTTSTSHANASYAIERVFCEAIDIAMRRAAQFRDDAKRLNSSVFPGNASIIALLLRDPSTPDTVVAALLQYVVVLGKITDPRTLGMCSDSLILALSCRVTGQSPDNFSAPKVALAALRNFIRHVDNDILSARRLQTAAERPLIWSWLIEGVQGGVGSAERSVFVALADKALRDACPLECKGSGMCVRVIEELAQAAQYAADSTDGSSAEICTFNSLHRRAMGLLHRELPETSSARITVHELRAYLQTQDAEYEDELRRLRLQCADEEKRRICLEAALQQVSQHGVAVDKELASMGPDATTRSLRASVHELTDAVLDDNYGSS